MRKYSIRPAVKDDFDIMYSRMPEHASQSWSVDFNGKLVAMAGVIYTPCNNLVFSDIINPEEHSNIRIWKQTIKVFEKIKELNKDLLAVCTGDFENSGPFLERLGFEYSGDCEGKETYRWHKL